MKKILILVFVIILALAFVPFETTLVPEWKVRIIDEHGNPYKGILVRQFCDSYTLGVSPCEESADFMQYSDSNGYVVFPRRAISLSAISRVGRALYNFLNLFVHGSYGKRVYLDAEGPLGIQELEFDDTKPPSREFVLRSKR